MNLKTAQYSSVGNYAVLHLGNQGVTFRWNREEEIPRKIFVSVEDGLMTMEHVEDSVVIELLKTSDAWEPGGQVRASASLGFLGL